VASDERPVASGESGAIPGSPLSPARCSLYAPAFLALMTLILAGAAALRFADLGNRPMHCDEAVHAVKFGRLLEQGEYVYDPREYHGPSLNYLTLPIAWAAGAEKLTEVSETQLRLVPALFGVALVGLVWLVRDELGRAAALWAAALTAVSPAMVFYSRYYVQETLLVGFTFGAIVALWRYARAVGRVTSGPGCRGRLAWLRRAFWLVLLGLSIGMMHATKETCVIALAVMGVAAAASMRNLHRNRGAPGGKRQVASATSQAGNDPDSPLTTHHSPLATHHSLLLAGCVVVLTAAGVSALFFSSFLENPRGVVDSYTAYFHYLGRASGEGSVGGHVHAPDYYLRVLFWWHRPGGPVWSEAAIAVLALVGMVAGALGKGLKPATLPMVRFLGIYTVLMTAVYSALPYKTPWCALSLLQGMILLAGVGATVLVGTTRVGYASAYLDSAGASACHQSADDGQPRDMLKHNLQVFRLARFWPPVAIVLLAAVVGHLAWQAHRASFVAYEDPSNPYVYAQTTSDVPALAAWVGQIAAVHPEGRNLHVQVICPDDDYWPLPWYLRGFGHVGWFGGKPHGPAAPLIIAQPEMEPLLVEYLYQDQPPGKRNLYVPASPPAGRADWQLRPHVPLRVYARLDLWEGYEGTHPEAR
jgi:uncharacterized protein (TIGR03663 family)